MDWKRRNPNSLVLILFVVLFRWPIMIYAQSDTLTMFKLPSVTIKTTDGQQFSTINIKNAGKPVILCFWKTCCKPPENLLEALAEVYEDWKTKTGVIIYAVSVDDTRSSSRVKSFTESKAWEFEVLLDPNSDFKRAMNVNALPHLFLIDGEGQIVWQKILYEPGMETEVEKELMKLVK